jgi:hypothetical protein
LKHYPVVVLKKCGFEDNLFIVIDASAYCRYLNLN